MKVKGMSSWGSARIAKKQRAAFRISKLVCMEVVHC